MKVKLDINSVAVKQLESAIWMYAYDYDEVAVHTIAGAAFEIYTKRLGLTSFEEDIKKYVKPEKAREFISLWNKPYNYFKHGEHKRQKLDYIDYSEDTVEVLILLACEGNLKGSAKYRLSAANAYRIYFALKYPEVFEKNFYQEHYVKAMKKVGIDPEPIENKEVLKLFLDNMGNTFLNGTSSPFRNVKPK
jgi:hypothetical protein